MTRAFAVTMAEILVGGLGWPDSEVGLCRVWLREQDDADLFAFVRAVVGETQPRTPERATKTLEALADMQAQIALRRGTGTA